MNGTLLEIIEERMNQFTRAERKVANYTLLHPEKVIHMSITNLAEESGVGDTSVFRFCRTLHLDGYQEFRMMIAQAISRPNQIPLLTLSEEIAIEDTAEEVGSKLLQSNIAALQETYQHMDFEKIRAAVQFLNAARTIHLYGVGGSGVVAQEARSRFSNILPNVVAVPDSHMQAASSALLSPQDVAIAFSYSGSSRDTVDNLRRAKDCMARTLCITRYAESPLTHYADIVLLCAGEEGPFQGGSLSTKLTQLYVIDVLYTEYFKTYFTQSDQNKRKTTHSISNKLL